MAKRKPEKVTSLGEVVKGCFALVVLFLLVCGAIFTFVVPPAGIIVFILGFCLLLVFGKIYGQHKEPKKESLVSQAQQTEDAAQQIIDGLGLLQKSRPLDELLSYLVGDKLLSYLESKLKSSGISVEQVIDAVERKIKVAKIQEAKPTQLLTEKEVEDVAQQICDAHGLLPRLANSRPPDGKLPPGMKFSEKNLDRVMDAVERKVMESKALRVTVKLDKLLNDNKFEKRANAVISRIQKESEELKTQIQEYHEWIEIINISGKRHIFCVGKEGWGCHCWRLNSNPNIIKVRKYSTDYPFDLIDTQGAMQSQHEFFEQVSFDKKTNTEKPTTTRLAPWRLFDKQEFEQKCLEANGRGLNAVGVHEDVIAEKQWIEEIAAKKRRMEDWL
jgi:hypothetical protein